MLGLGVDTSSCPALSYKIDCLGIWQRELLELHFDTLLLAHDYKPP